MKRNFTLFSVLVLAAFWSGCCDDPPLTIEGHVLIRIDGGETGFSFSRETNLAVPSDGSESMSGECVVRPDESGGELLILAPGPVHGQSRQLRSLYMVVDGEGGEVVVELGQTQLSGRPSDECEIELAYANSETGQLGITMSCVLSSGEEHADSVADLHLSGCNVE